MDKIAFMKHLSVLAFGMLLAASGSAAQSDFKTFIKAMVPKVEKAFATKDYGFFDSVAAPDYVNKEMGQTLNRKQAMDEMKVSMAMTKSMKINLNLVSADASGGTGHAVLTGSASFVSKPDKSGKSHVMSAQFTEHQTWVRTGSKWKLKVQEDTFSNMTQDGKPMKPGKGG